MIWYQINPDYFSDIARSKNYVASDDNSLLFSIIQKSLTSIFNNGFDGIWLMPLYIRGVEGCKGKGSPYAVKEYVIDNRYGTDEELIQLIKSAHEMGFKIITEFIPNHLSIDNVYISSHPNIIYKNIDGEHVYDQNWTDTIKLNNSEKKTSQFIINVLKSIISKYSFDGFRLDMAHYSFYDPDGKRTRPNFWTDIIKNSFLNSDAIILIAEVYDDKNNDDMGYADQIELVKSGMQVYDKKIRDIVISNLKYPNSSIIQETIYSELCNQFNASIKAGLVMNNPFLRIISNHDDNPGVKDSGGISNYILLSTFLCMLPGDLMIYNGDEFGLEVKLSLQGEDVFDEFGNLKESKKLHYVKETDQEIISKNIIRLFNIRKSLKNIPDNSFFQIRLTSNDNNVLNNVAAYIRYSEYTNKLYVICANFSSDAEIWCNANQFYPEFGTKLQLNFQSLYKDIFGNSSKYSVTELITGQFLNNRNIAEDFYIGLKPKQVQILSISAV